MNSLTDRVGSTTYRTESAEDLNGLYRCFFDRHTGYDGTLDGEHQTILLAYTAVYSADWLDTTTHKTESTGISQWLTRPFLRLADEVVPHIDNPLDEPYYFASPMARFAFATKPSSPLAFNLPSQ